MNDPLDDLYRDIIMDHYRFPRGHRHLDHASIRSEGKNPSCGDEIELELVIDREKVKDLSISCKGCAISVASGSMLVELVKGKSLDEVKKIARAVRGMLKGDDSSEIKDMDLGDIEALQGVRDYPVRIKCALLSWTTLIDSIESWEHANSVKVSSED